MPEALKEGTTYVLTDETGEKTQFVYRGQNPDNGRIQVEIAGKTREYADLTELAGGHFSAVMEVD